MKLIVTIIGVAIFSSCTMHLVKNPGPQISSTIEKAKENHTLVNVYEVKVGNINGIKIASVFAEKKYFSDGGLFSNYDIDCCRSQLVIISSTFLASDGTGFDITWKIPGFKLYNSKIIYKDYKGIVLPDSIPIHVVKIEKQDSSYVVQKLMLYKLK